MRLGAEAELKWVRGGSFITRSCCSFILPYVRCAVAPDGSVYTSGTIEEGIDFGSRQLIAQWEKKPASEKSRPREPYLAAYGPNGELKWAKSSGGQSTAYSIAADESGVYQSIQINSNAHPYGVDADTTGGRGMAVTAFDPKGKLRWLKTFGADRADDMGVDGDGNLYLLGTFGEGRTANPPSGIIDKDTLNKHDKLYLACLAPNGAYRWHKQADAPVTTLNESLRLQMDHCDNLFVVGYLWFILPAQMSWWDDAFVRGKGYGGAPLIARFSNTIPTAVIDRMEPQERKHFGDGKSCIISPGPWKIRNYPNPFADQTTVEYTLSYSDIARLELWSIDGKLLKTLFDGEMIEAGTHTYSFSEELSSGVYMLRLIGTGMVASVRIVSAH